MKDKVKSTYEFILKHFNKPSSWLNMSPSEFFIIALFVSFYIFILTRWFWFLPAPSDPLVYVGPAVDRVSGCCTYTFDRIALYINLRLFSHIFNNSYISSIVYMVFIGAATLTIAMIWAVKRSNIWAAIIFGVLFNTSFLTLGEGVYVYPDQTIAFYSLIAFIIFFSDIKTNKYIGPIFFAGVFAALASFTKIIGTTTFIFFLIILISRKNLRNLINYLLGASCSAIVTMALFCILYDYDIPGLYNKARDLIVSFFPAATSLPFGNAYTQHEMLLSLVYFPFIVLFIMAGAYKNLTKYLFLIAWSFIIFIYATVLVNVGSAPPLPHYIWSAYIFVCLGLALYLANSLGSEMPLDKYKKNMAAPLILSLLLVIVILVGLQLGFNYGAVKTWSSGYISLMPIDIFHYDSFLANTYPKSIKLIFSIGPIIILGSLIVIEVTKSKRAIISFIIIAAFWCSFFNGGLSLKHAQAVRHDTGIYYSFAPVLNEIPSKFFCIYLSNNPGMTEYSIKWIYRLFFNNKYPKPKTLVQMTDLMNEIDKDIVVINNLYNITGEYILTDDPKSLVAIHPDVEKYKSVKWEGRELYIFKLTDQTFKRLEETYPKKSLIKNGSFEKWPDASNLGPFFWSCTSKIIKEPVAKFGYYSAKIVGDDNYNLSQNLSNPEIYRGETITLFAWLKTSIKEKYRMEIYDGVNSSYSDFHTGNGKWQLLALNHKVGEKAKFIELRAIQAHKTGNNDPVVYVDGVLLFRGNLSDPRKNLTQTDEN